MELTPITLAELARRSNIPARTLRYAIEKGALPARRRGLRKWTVTIADAERYVGHSIGIGNSGNNADNRIAAPSHAA